MIRSRGIQISTSAALATLILIFTGSAAAQNTISLQGGYFEPWRGEEGGSAVIQYQRKLDSRNFLGFEIEYQNFEGKIAEVNDFDIQAYHLRAVYRVDLLLDSMVTPYVGLGTGFSINHHNDRKLERELERRNPGSSFSARPTGGGLGVLGLVGIELGVRRMDWISIFGEARFEYGVRFTHVEETRPSGPGFLETNTKTNTLGGISGQGGVRFHF